MTFVSKNADNPKFKIDMSEGKYRSRRDGLLNILFHSAELPNDLYKEMNLSYDYYRKLISDLLQSGLIMRISQDGMAGYRLTLKGKNLTNTKINYLKYRPCVEEETDRHYTAKRRRRKRNFSYWKKKPIAITLQSEEEGKGTFLICMHCLIVWE